MDQDAGSMPVVAAKPVEDRDLCFLLQLPAELRLHIYNYLLEGPEALLAGLRPFTTRNHLSSYVIPPLNICPNILRTCRRIHDEAASILYKSNVFCAHPTQLTDSPFLISSDRIVYHSRFKGHIRRWYISLRLDTDPRTNAKDVEAAFNGMDSLEIEVWQAMFASADLHVLKLFEGVRDVSRAKIYGSVGKRYSDWLVKCITSPSDAVVEPFVEDHIWDTWTHGSR